MCQPTERFSDLLGITKDTWELQVIRAKAQLFNRLILGDRLLEQLLTLFIINRGTNLYIESFVEECTISC